MNGATAPIGAPGLYLGFEPSPDGRFLLVTRLKRPFSYIVPAFRFPTEIAVWDMSGRQVHRVVDRPLADDVLPAFDAVVVGPRNVDWRADAPATLAWAETQDGGDPARGRAWLMVAGADPVRIVLPSAQSRPNRRHASLDHP